MDIYINNSLSRKKEIFKPIHDGFVGMYVCGPTVYGPPHVGHARSYVNFDIIRRFFEYSGYKVKYVQNITDVGHIVGDVDEGDDKILVQAAKENLDPYALAYKYETIYFDSMDKLNVKKPTISVRATAVIPEIIDMVQKIIDKGYAYVTKSGNVYLELSKVDSYGKLSGRKIENGLSGERIEIADDKKNPEDCALWKSASGGHIMKWNSPWGMGYPGWHIECSAISKKFLGNTFDIHGGGLDNIFPHHETEIAQSEIANGVPFVNYFIHNNLITVNGTKMGKSLGNFITLEDLFKKFDPMVVRYFILQFHYRKPVDFSMEQLTKAQEQFEKISNAFSKIKEISNGEVASLTDSTLLEIKQNFESAMCDDFNTPLAIAEVLRLARFTNQVILSNNINLAKELNILVKMVEDVLGFEFKSAIMIAETSSNDEKLIEIISNVRNKLRADKNYELSDFIRDELVRLEIDVKDKKI